MHTYFELQKIIEELEEEINNLKDELNDYKSNLKNCQDNYDKFVDITIDILENIEVKLINIKIGI